MRKRLDRSHWRKIATVLGLAFLFLGGAGIAVLVNNSYAEMGDGEILFNGATSMNFVGDGGVDIHYQLDDQDVAISFASFWGNFDNNAKALYYDPSTTSLVGNLEFYVNGNFSQNYSAQLQSQDGFHVDFQCSYSQGDNDGGITNCILPSGDYGIPESTTFVINSNQPDNPYDGIQNPFQIFYDGINNDFTTNMVSFNMGGDELSNVPLTLHGMTFENGKTVVERNDLFASNTELYYEVSNLFDPETMEIVIDGTDQYRATLAVNNGRADFSGLNVPGDIVTLRMSRKNEGGGPERPDHPGEDTTARVTVTSSSAHAKSFADARIELNTRPIITSECEPGQPCDVPNSVTVDEFHYNYDAEHDNGMVTFGLSTLFIQKITSVTINGQTINIPIDYEDELSCLHAYDHQILGFSVEVPKADEYNIVIDVEDNPGENVCVSNFLWTNNPELANEDIYVAHSHLELVRVEWMPPNTPEEDEDEARIIVEGADLYDLPAEMREKGMIVEYEDESSNDRHIGSLVVPAFALVTMRIVPEYGYQVTSFGINGQNVITGDAISEFTFNVHKGNFHIGAEVTAVDDVVKSETSKVKSGTIELGGTEISTGTAVMTVTDANVSPDQIANFERTAGDYNVSTYLNINLDQVFYKGDGDEDNYWNGEEMKDLVHDATVTLRLANGVDGNSVVIIHEKHDGSYEIIPTTYNPANHTITFKTSSFSNYAIASTTTKNISGPSTGDRLIAYGAILITGMTVLVLLARVRANSVK